ncbi:hypothetical protein [Brenneria alni]|nr:hypothetical protein [Brenneria alni]
MSRTDAAKASAAPGARQWRFDRRPPIPKAPRQRHNLAGSLGSQGGGD